MLLTKISAIHHPVSAMRTVRQNSGFVHVSSFRGSIGGRSGDESKASQANRCNRDENLSCLQKGPFLGKRIRYPASGAILDSNQKSVNASPSHPPTWLGEEDQEISSERRIPQSSNAVPASEDPRPSQRPAHPAAGSRGCETTRLHPMR
jgi:hypothetical protein